ncbi:MAG: thioredoxin [Bacteroidales bacterium]|nr:thioredoxin [Bacteroidales bacterium]
MRKVLYLVSLCSFLMLMACSPKQGNSASQSGNVSVTSEDETASNASKDEIVDSSSSKIIVIDFFATWCGPCKAMAPAMEQMQEKYGDKIIIRKIDVDEEQALAQQYQIESIPTLVVISPSGEVLDKVVGAQPVEVLDEMFSKLASMQIEE